MVIKHLRDLRSVETHFDSPKLLFPALYDYKIEGSDINTCTQDYAKGFNKRKFAKEFWQKYSTSTRIIIIDDYFYNIPIEYISECLNDAAQLKIYTGRKIKKVEEELKKLECKNISLFKTDKKLQIHDRYAILDDELFHFGSTVGGYEEHFTAYTRGWDVRKIEGLLNFLESKDCIYGNFIKEVKL